MQALVRLFVSGAKAIGRTRRYGTGNGIGCMKPFVNYGGRQLCFYFLCHSNMPHTHTDPRGATHSATDRHKIGKNGMIADFWYRRVPRAGLSFWLTESRVWAKHIRRTEHPCTSAPLHPVPAPLTLKLTDAGDAHRRVAHQKGHSN